MDFVFLDLSYTKFMNLLLDVISNQWRIRIPERGPNPFFASDVQKKHAIEAMFLCGSTTAFCICLLSGKHDTKSAMIMDPFDTGM